MISIIAIVNLLHVIIACLSVICFWGKMSNLFDRTVDGCEKDPCWKGSSAGNEGFKGYSGTQIYIVVVLEGLLLK